MDWALLNRLGEHSQQQQHHQQPLDKLQQQQQVQIMSLVDWALLNRLRLTHKRRLRPHRE